jgi:hypothetical protein
MLPGPEDFVGFTFFSSFSHPFLSMMIGFMFCFALSLVVGNSPDVGFVKTDFVKLTILPEHHFVIIDI